MTVLLTKDNVEAADQLYDRVVKVMQDLPTSSLAALFDIDDGKALFDFISTLRGIHEFLSKLENGVYALLNSYTEKQIVRIIASYI